MRDRLFTVIDGQPVIDAPILNLGPFKRLFELDKSDDNSMYKKWMLYIYYMCDYRSPFFELKNKQEEVFREVFQRVKMKVPGKVEECIKEYRKRIPAEQRTLEAAINSADGINDMIARFQTESKQLTELIEAIEKEIKVAMGLAEVGKATAMMKEKMDLQSTYLDIAKKMADLIPKVEKNVQSIINLRDKVDKAMRQLEESPDRLESYIIDSLLELKARGEFLNE